MRLRGVYVENASWAAKRPLVVAGEISFTVALKTLWDERKVLSRLVLIDADVDMERQADGLRNWRLLHPDDRGPGKVRVLALEAHRSQLRFANRSVDLDFVATASDAGKEKATAGNEALASRIAFKGIYHGAAFAGEALAGEVLTFRETGRAFPVRGHIVSGKTRLDVDGFLSDLFDLGPMDVQLRLAGPTLTRLHPFLEIQPPPSKPFEFEARLVQADNEYKFSRLKGRIGSTDLAGQATYDRRPQRPLVHVALRSESADVADLAPLVGMRESGAKATASQQGDSPFPARPLHTEALKAVDARVTMHAVKLKSAEIAMLESGRVTAELTDGVLNLKPVDVGIAGGHVSGSMTFNGSGRPASVRAAIDLQNLQIEKLMPSLSTKTHSSGSIVGEIRFAGSGASIAAILGSATGSIAARMEGGRISNLADAKLGLNAGKILAVMLRGDRDIAINCGAVAFEFHGGVGKSQTIVLDTEQTHVDGTGAIDLVRSSVDVLLTPQPKKPGLFTRPASIRVHGPFGRTETSLQERVALGRGGNDAPQNAKPCGALR